MLQGKKTMRVWVHFQISRSITVFLNYTLFWIVADINMLTITFKGVILMLFRTREPIITNKIIIIMGKLANVPLKNEYVK